jgi:hypothetical protein
MIVAHIAGVPVEEWVMPVVISAGAALAGIRASLRRALQRDAVGKAIDSVDNPVRTANGTVH